MPIVAKLDELGRPAWIILMILGFIVWWPLGLAALAFMLGSGRMGCWSHRSAAHWQDKMERMQEKMDRVRGHMDRMGAPRIGGAASVERQSSLRRIPD